MPDRIEREIEEILSRLNDDEEPPSDGERKPIPIESRRRAQPRTSLGSRLGAAFSLPSIPTGRMTPTSLLFTGAGVMIVGFILAAIWGALIWLSFAGVALFAAAFIWSFVRSPRRGGGSAQPSKGAYWRGRYVQYEPAAPGMLSRLKRAIRRR